MSNEPTLSKIKKIKGFDLNLLSTFEAVYEHLSVTRAASLLDVSPSAVSQSLTKLRSFFLDPLFVREGNGLVATTAAENLHLQLSNNFSHLLDSLTCFSEEMTRSRFVIHATPYLGLRLLPDICAAAQARKLNCEILHISADAMLDETEDILTYRKADIIFDIRPHYSFSTISEPLLVEEAIAICRKDHPRIGTTLGKEDMKNETSTYLALASTGIKRTQSDIQDYFCQRDFSFSSSSIILNMGIAEKTDSVSFITRWFAGKFLSSFNVKVLDCSFNPEPVTIYMTYNKTSLKNKSFAEFIDIIHQLKGQF